MGVSVCGSVGKEGSTHRSAELDRRFLFARQNSKSRVQAATHKAQLSEQNPFKVDACVCPRAH